MWYVRAPVPLLALGFGSCLVLLHFLYGVRRASFPPVTRAYILIRPGDTWYIHIFFPCSRIITYLPTYVPGNTTKRGYWVKGPVG